MTSVQRLPREVTVYTSGARLADRSDSFKNSLGSIRGGIFGAEQGGETGRTVLRRWKFGTHALPLCFIVVRILYRHTKQHSLCMTLEAGCGCPPSGGLSTVAGEAAGNPGDYRSANQPQDGGSASSFDPRHTREIKHLACRSAANSRAGLHPALGGGDYASYSAASSLSWVRSSKSDASCREQLVAHRTSSPRPAGSAQRRCEPVPSKRYKRLSRSFYSCAPRVDNVKLPCEKCFRQTSAVRIRCDCIPGSQH